MIHKLNNDTKVSMLDLTQHNILKIELYANSHPIIEDEDEDGEIYIEYNTGIKLDLDLTTPKLVLLAANSNILGTDLYLPYTVPSLKDLTNKHGFRVSFKLSPLGFSTTLINSKKDYITYGKGDMIGTLIIYK